MNNSMYSAMVTMGGIQQRLDLIADNMANIDTVGYKRKESTFEDTLTAVNKQSKEFNLPGRATPSGFNLGFGAYSTAATLNFVEGSIQDTDKLTDLAIEGEGLLTVQAEGGVEAYTRAGDLHVQPDQNDPDNAFLVTSQGYYVLNTDGDPIELPARAAFKIDREGNIVVSDATGDNVIGKLQLYKPIRSSGLYQKDNNIFMLATGVAKGDILADNENLTQEERVHVRQFALEKSNVDMSKEMTDMMQVQRAYQLAARALTSSDTMMSLANNLRG